MTFSHVVMFIVFSNFYGCSDKWNVHNSFPIGIVPFEPTFFYPHDYQIGGVKSAINAGVGYYHTWINIHQCVNFKIWLIIPPDWYACRFYIDDADSDWWANQTIFLRLKYFFCGKNIFCSLLVNGNWVFTRCSKFCLSDSQSIDWRKLKMMESILFCCLMSRSAFFIWIIQLKMTNFETSKSVQMQLFCFFYVFHWVLGS